MTKKQIKFLKSIYTNGKTAEELCKELKITSSKIDPMGGYYNALNEYIDHLKFDDKNEIEDMFQIIPCNGEISNHDMYIITSKGRSYIESYNRGFKRYIIGVIISVIAIIVAIAIAILA